MKKNEPIGGLAFHSLKKTLLIMRIVVILLLVGFLQSRANDAYSQKTRLSINFSDTELVTVLDKIENLSEFYFLYNEKLIDANRKVTINAVDEKIEEVLKTLFSGTDVQYSILDRKIILAPSYMSAEQQAGKKISGKVTDSSGATLPGVSVVLKGTTTGVITDIDGKYSISKLPDNAILQFSFVGMKTQEVRVGTQSTISVVLSEESFGIEEVVAVGYGTQKRSSLTSAISTITAESIKDRSKSNVMQSIAGKLAGVQILQTDGAAGFSPTVKIRGTVSITAGTTPLYVIDGMPIEEANLNMINPSDIESMEILKDASSSAIYGSRGSNGVVIITTKSGKTGKTNLEFNYEKGFSKIIRKIDMMNTQEWIRYYVDANNNSWIAQGGKADDPNSIRPSSFRIPPEFLTDPGKFGNGTDWQGAIFRMAPSDNVSLSLSGGNEKTKFSVSSSILTQDGIVDNNSFERMTLRSNITHNILPNLVIGTSILLTKKNEVPLLDRNGNYNMVGQSSVVSDVLQNTPLYPLYNENGNYGPLDPNSEWNRFLSYNFVFVHPYAMTREIQGKLRSFNSLANVFLEWKFSKGLTFKTNIGAKIDNSRYNGYINNLQRYGWNKVVAASGFAKSDYRYNWLSENTITYERGIGEHSINALLGYSAQKDYFENSSLIATNFPNDAVQTLNAATTASSFSTNATEWSLLSYFSRVNYSYKEKYLLTATIRRDGSSRFGKNNKWGYFPSASIGWRISEEDFFDPIKWINSLKIRLSYGVTGNNLISNYGSIGLLGQAQYAQGSIATQALFVNSISDPNLKWEKTGQLDAGLNIGLFSNRIYIEFDYYKSVTKDMLLNVPVPALTGFTSQLKNIGEIRNNGIELLLSTKNLVGNFKWTTDFNISANRNKVLKLGPDASPIYTTKWGSTKTEIGKTVANFYGYIFDGVFMNQKEVDNYPHTVSTTPGDPKIRDVNGDQKIDSNDRTTIGNAQPDFVFGLTNTFNYKDFDLSFSLQGQYGNEIINSQSQWEKMYNGGRNLYAITTNYWKSESDPGDGKIFKPMVTYNGLQAAFSSYCVEDGSFLRIRNVQLGYNLPKHALSWSHLSSARVYVNAENLYVFTSYLGFDPENSAFSGLELGNDFGASPMPRTITFGIKVNL